MDHSRKITALSVIRADQTKRVGFVPPVARTQGFADVTEGEGVLKKHAIVVCMVYIGCKNEVRNRFHEKINEVIC